MRAGDVKVALRWTTRAVLFNGSHGAARREILGILRLIAAELRIEGFVLVGHLLPGGGFCLLDVDGARFVVWGIDARRERREVATTVAELVLDRERREATEAPPCLVCLLKALGEQSSLECEGVEW
jgi:hypothetical protein